MSALMDQGKLLPSAFALRVIQESHAFYKQLKMGTRPNDEGLALA